MSLNVVVATVLMVDVGVQAVPWQRSITYPVTATLSVDPLHARSISLLDRATTVRPGGAVGACVSGEDAVIALATLALYTRARRPRQIEDKPLPWARGQMPGTFPVESFKSIPWRRCLCLLHRRRRAPMEFLYAAGNVCFGDGEIALHNCQNFEKCTAGDSSLSRHPLPRSPGLSTTDAPGPDASARARSSPSGTTESRAAAR